MLRFCCEAFECQYVDLRPGPDSERDVAACSGIDMNLDPVFLIQPSPFVEQEHRRGEGTDAALHCVGMTLKRYVGRGMRHYVGVPE